MIMEKFFKNFINDKTKKLKWYNTNFFYLSTLLLATGMVIGYSIFKTQSNPITDSNNFWNVLLITFNHRDITHITFNIIMLMLISLMLERHFGSFTYLIMLICLIPIANLTYFALKSLLYNYDTEWSARGESCLNFCLIGFSLIVVAFNFKKYVMTKNAFVFFIPLAFNLFFTSVDTSHISTMEDFFAHPSMKFLMVFYNESHYGPFFMGIIVGLLIYTIIKTTIIANKRDSV